MIDLAVKLLKQFLANHILYFCWSVILRKHLAVNVCSTLWLYFLCTSTYLKPRPGFPTPYILVFCVQLFEKRGSFSFFWYWCNCWWSLFKFFKNEDDNIQYTSLIHCISMHYQMDLYKISLSNYRYSLETQSQI